MLFVFTVLCLAIIVLTTNAQPKAKKTAASMTQWASTVSYTNNDCTGIPYSVVAMPANSCLFYGDSCQNRKLTVSDAATSESTPSSRRAARGNRGLEKMAKDLNAKLKAAKATGLETAGDKALESDGSFGVAFAQLKPYVAAFGLLAFSDSACAVFDGENTNTNIFPLGCDGRGDSWAITSGPPALPLSWANVDILVET